VGVYSEREGFACLGSEMLIPDLSQTLDSDSVWGETLMNTRMKSIDAGLALLGVALLSMVSATGAAQSAKDSEEVSAYSERPRRKQSS